MNIQLLKEMAEKAELKKGILCRGRIMKTPEDIETKSLMFSFSKGMPPLDLEDFIAVPKPFTLKADIEYVVVHVYEPDRLMQMLGGPMGVVLAEVKEGIMVDENVPFDAHYIDFEEISRILAETNLDRFAKHVNVPHSSGHVFAPKQKLVPIPGKVMDSGDEDVPFFELDKEEYRISEVDVCQLVLSIQVEEVQPDGSVEILIMNIKEMSEYFSHVILEDGTQVAL